MTITTKFDIGEKIFFIYQDISRKLGIYSAPIAVIGIHIDDRGIGVKYYLDFKNWRDTGSTTTAAQHLFIAEEDMFKTREELVKTLEDGDSSSTAT
jgi:hypothetical protein